MNRKTPATLSLRVDFDHEHRLGPGKVRLLELIGATGSISEASRQMNMSYRHAWGLLEDINETFGRHPVVGYPGGSNGGGAQLTAFG